MNSKIALTAAPLLLLALPPTYAAQNNIGQASVIDGDTIEIHGQRIRLWGIDAPESSQLCRNGNSDLYRCGAEAANTLSAFTSGKVVNCESVDRDRYGRIVARCSVNGVDIAEWLVRNGLALDWPRYSHGRYGSAQDGARREEKGIWAGTWTPPWEYRACVTGGGRPSACSDGER
ncbi:thermonuclease family protein [Afipia sp. 1NLS2]|uniref:thermonuclease family protein n=1 Tax=Afipia sp. 1NLS2 TaxID=666684 RepID=UPI0003120CD4|nr:thermonuclease family protein [Afipia sp. 1NLS2]